MSFEEILANAPYSLAKEEKEALLTERLVELTELHKKNCPEYGKILDSFSYAKKKVGPNFSEKPAAGEHSKDHDVFRNVRTGSV